nr:hypothetical protein [Actinopolymorpha alba]
MLGWTNYRADQFMLIALALSDLPNTRGALERGELEFSEVRTIVDRLTLLPPADRVAVDEAIFPQCLHRAPARHPRRQGSASLGIPRRHRPHHENRRGRTHPPPNTCRHRHLHPVRRGRRDHLRQRA